MSSVDDIVARVWGLCDILRDDGITFHQYLNELSYLLFLKLAHETGTESGLPRGSRWTDLVGRSGDVGPGVVAVGREVQTPRIGFQGAGE